MTWGYPLCPLSLTHTLTHALSHTYTVRLNEEGERERISRRRESVHIQSELIRTILSVCEKERERERERKESACV